MNPAVRSPLAILWSLLACSGCSSGPTSEARSTTGGEAGSDTVSPTSNTGGESSAAGAGGGAPSSGGAPSAGTAGASPSEPAGSGGTTAPASSGGATATGGATTVASGLPKSCSDVCNAATPVNPQLTDYGALGNVTMYTELASDGGACQYGSTGVMYFAAIDVNLEPNDGLGQWQEGRICGQCVEVTALTSEGPKQVVVRIMDKCADGYCGIDLGGEAPADLMVDGFGRYEGAWRLVSCVGHPETYDGEPSLFVKDGSNAYWSAVQVRNPDTAVTGIEWQKQSDPGSQGDFAYASPSIENYYLVATEVLQGNATYDLTVRYADGATATVSLTSAELAEPEASYPLD